METREVKKKGLDVLFVTKSIRHQKSVFLVYTNHSSFYSNIDEEEEGRVFQQIELELLCPCVNTVKLTKARTYKSQGFHRNILVDRAPL